MNGSSTAARRRSFRVGCNCRPTTRHRCTSPYHSQGRGSRARRFAYNARRPCRARNGWCFDRISEIPPPKSRPRPPAAGRSPTPTPGFRRGLATGCAAPGSRAGAGCRPRIVRSRRSGPTSADRERRPLAAPGCAPPSCPRNAAAPRRQRGRGPRAPSAAARSTRFGAGQATSVTPPCTARSTGRANSRSSRSSSVAMLNGFRRMLSEPMISPERISACPVIRSAFICG
jgi:hypothetical protein